NIPCEVVSARMPEADVLSLNKSGYLTEFEVKISRGDFLADKKKDKWIFYSNKVESQIPNYFYYACPIGLISEDEIPSFAGLVYVSLEGIELVKRAKLNHKEKKPPEQLLTTFARLYSERTYLGCARLTYENNIIRERNKKIR